MNNWLRLWHDMPNDPKFRTIARISGQRIGDVIAVFLHVLVDASANANERGRTQSFSSEDVASALDLSTEDVEAIVGAMQGRVLDGEHVIAWSRRQPEREDGSAERARAWREARKQARTAGGNAERTQANASERTPNAEERPDTDTDTEKCLEACPLPKKQEEGGDFPSEESPDQGETKKRERPGLPKCPSERIADLWDEVLPELRSPVMWTPKRQRAVSTRWREMAAHYRWRDVEQGMTWFRQAFMRVRDSDFLMGRVQPREKGRSPFRLEIDWLFAPTNWLKFVEGKYHE